MFTVETLERRQLLSVTAIRSGTTLTIRGDADDNDIRIERFDSNLVISNNYGRGGGGLVKILTIADSLVARIDVFCYAGDDKVTVAESVTDSLYVYGGKGADRIKGGGGSSSLYGHGYATDSHHNAASDDGAADHLSGGFGTNFMYGQAGNDTLLSCPGSALFNSGIDFMFGGDGNDTLHINARGGNAYVYGDAGRDTFKPAQDRLGQIAYLNGGDGWDMLDYSAWTQPVWVFCGSGRSGFEDEPDAHDRPHRTGQDVEAFGGGSGDDTFRGGSSGPFSRLVNAGAGHDYVDVSESRPEGRLTVLLGPGNDYCLAGSAGSVDGATVLGGTGNDTIFGGGGHDRLYGEEGHDSIAGGPGDDYLHGGAGNDTLAGGYGSDTIDSRDGVFGNDQVFGEGRYWNNIPGDHDAAWLDVSFEVGWDAFTGIEELHGN
jgi:Ca2+-binding RTX toxin-like protein